MKHKQRGLVLLLIAGLLAAMASGRPVNVQASGTIPNREADFDWPAETPAAFFSFDPESHAITDYSGDDEIIVVPAEIDGLAVLAIGEDAFHGVAMKALYLPDGIRLIDVNAFAFCDDLERIRLPETLEVIDGYAFIGCTVLEEVTFPASLLYIGSHAFKGAVFLRQATFLGRIPAFGYDALAFGADPEPVLYVNEEDAVAFETVLNRTVTPAGLAHIYESPATEGVLFVAEDGTLTGYEGKALTLSLPAQIDGVTLREIGENAFLQNKTLRVLNLPETVEKIGARAFHGSRLSAVNLPEGLQEIGEEAFVGSRISFLDLPDSLTRIGRRAFASTSLSEIVISQGLEEILFETFWNTNLEYVEIPDSLVWIDERAFADNPALDYLVLTGEKAPDMAADAFAGARVEDIDIAWDASREDALAVESAFVAAGLEEDSFLVWRANPPHQPPYPPIDVDMLFDDDTGLVTFYEGDLERMTMYWSFWSASEEDTLVAVSGLGEAVFEGASLKEFFMPHSGDFVTIGDRAFQNSDLESIYLFDSLLSIGDAAFAGCASLTSLVLPSSVSQLGSGLLEDCPALVEVVLPPAAELGGPLGVDLRLVRFAAETTDAELAVWAEKLDYPFYLRPLRVGEDEVYVSAPEDLVANPASDFDFDVASGSILNYVGPSGVVVVPAEIEGLPVRRIGVLAFANLSLADGGAVTAIVLPESLREIEDSAFLSAPELEKVECYGPLDRLGIRAFEDCEKLSEVHFYNGVDVLEVYAFNQNKALQVVDFGGRLRILPEGAFADCGLTGELVLDYEEIGPNAFSGCSQLSGLRLTDKVQRVHDGAFLNMDGLEAIYLENPDPAVFADAWFPFPATAKDLTLVLPGEASDEAVQDFVRLLEESGIEAAADRVVRE